MADETENIKECPICEKGESKGNQLIKNVSKDAFMKLKTAVSTRIELGQTDLLPLQTTLESADWQKLPTIRIAEN